MLPNNRKILTGEASVEYFVLQLFSTFCRYAKELAAWNKRIEKDGLKDEISLLEEKISMLNRKSKEL